MKTPFLVILAVLVSLSMLPAQTSTPVRIALFGDSTVADHQPEAKRQMWGWGYFLKDTLGPGYEVTNYSKGGRSSKSFWGYAQPALKEKYDFIVVQFGHNDQPGKGPERETDAATTYRDWIRKYIAAIRATGAKPILVTSVVRRNFRDDGTLDNDLLRPYAEAMIAVGREENVPVFDLNAVSYEMFQKMGKDKAMEFNADPTDFTHFNEAGGKQITALVADFLKKTIPAPPAPPQ